MNRRKAAVRRPPAELSVAVLKSFRLIYGSVRQHFRQVRRSCRISGSQLWILHELLRTKGIGVTELSVKLAIHQSTCSQHVENLVRSGFVKKTRHSNDQRRVELVVTAKGQRCVASAPGPAEGVLPEALAELSPAALRQLQQGLTQVIAALKVKSARDAHRHLADL
jgi:DNA-binding MarR family transcriptional regulator